MEGVRVIKRRISCGEELLNSGLGKFSGLVSVRQAFTRCVAGADRCTRPLTLAIHSFDRLTIVARVRRPDIDAARRPVLFQACSTTVDSLYTIPKPHQNPPAILPKSTFLLRQECVGN